jgi:hypothetical protein
MQVDGMNRQHIYVCTCLHELHAPGIMFIHTYLKTSNGQPSSEFASLKNLAKFKQADGRRPVPLILQVLPWSKRVIRVRQSSFHVKQLRAVAVACGEVHQRLHTRR